MSRNILCLAALLCAVGCRERLATTPALDKALAHRNVTQNTGGHKRTGPPKEVDKALTGGTLIFSDDFERSVIGDSWSAQSPAWRLIDGTIINRKADNAGFWLLKQLPEGNARIEFDARSDPYNRKIQGKVEEHFPGDIKCEAFGTKPEHQTGYIFIFGGWNNQVNRIARLEEHGDGDGARIEDGPSYEVKPGQTYRMKVIRVGNTVAWYADDKYLTHMTDETFIQGRYFGLNNWRSHLTFDNVEIYALK